MIAVLGTTTVDLLVSGLDHMPVPEGDEFTTDNFAFCSTPLNVVLGGNGANTAYVLATLGASPQLCSAIGRDRMGAIVRDWFEEADVGTDALVRSETDATATTVVIADEHRNRQSFHHAGATATFGFDDAPSGFFSGADALLVTGYQLLEGWRPDGMDRALTQADEAGATTLLDIGPAIDDPPTLSELAPLLPSVDYLLANAYELKTCTGTDDPARAADAVLAEGVHSLVLKRGGEGATLYGDDHSAEIVPAFDVDVHTTVGAGDAFNAGLIYALRHGHSKREAVRFANATAARVVSAPDGILGAPDADAVTQLLGSVPDSSS